MIGEVLSDATRGYDCGDKFAAYRTIATLAEYLLLEQEKVGVMHYVRQSPNQWVLTEYKELQDVCALQTPPVQLPLADLYDKVNWQL